MAVNLAKERAKIGADQEVALLVLPEKKSFFETVLERQEEGAMLKLAPRDVRGAVALARVLGELQRLIASAATSHSP